MNYQGIPINLKPRFGIKWNHQPTQYFMDCRRKWTHVTRSVTTRPRGPLFSLSINVCIYMPKKVYVSTAELDTLISTLRKTSNSTQKSHVSTFYGNPWNTVIGWSSSYHQTSSCSSLKSLYIARAGFGNQLSSVFGIWRLEEVVGDVKEDR